MEIKKKPTAKKRPLARKKQTLASGHGRVRKKKRAHG